MNKLTIVMYHYIRDAHSSRYKNIKGLDSKLFHDHIRFLKNKFNIITMEDAINSIYTNEKLPANPVLLTFDDGYIDHYNYAFPILDKYNIQGSFYISVKTAKERKLLDVNKLHYILSSEKRIGMIINEIGVLLKKYKNRYSLKK